MTTRPLPRLPRPLLPLYLLLALFSSAHAQTGSISGWVSNQATRNLLSGASIEVAALGLSTRTDDRGYYTLGGLPAGEHVVVASYAGLDPQSIPLRVTAGATTARNFDLTSAVYRLGEFKVSADREGAAAALTAQRNAGNVKNVIALDSYGDLPNLSVAELAGLMPGVAVNFSDDGVANGIQVRGASATLNRVTIDGGLKAGSGATRQFPSAQFTGAGFAEVELTKGHRPDTGADSLGGTVNLKSRSPLSMRERRRVDYTTSVRAAPSFTEQVAWRARHREHPLLNLGYMEVFDVAGGDRNLGISLNAFYSENANGLFVTDRLYQPSATSPPFNYDYRVQDKYNNRKIYSGRFLADLRTSPATTWRLIAGLVRNDEPYVHQYTARIFTNQVVGTTGTAGILPDYTDRITSARQTAASQIQSTDQMIRTWRIFGDVSLGAEHRWNRLQVDYTAAYSWNQFNRSTGKAGANLVSGISNIGWTIDRTRSELYPQFIQTGGADVRDPTNYRPIANGLTVRSQDDYEQVRGFTANARLQPVESHAVFLKAGLDWREVAIDQINRDRRYSYTGTAPLPHDSTAANRSGFGIPHWHPGVFVRGDALVDPTVWSQDAYYHEQLRYTGTRAATETVTAGYLMTEGRFARQGWLSRTGFLGGVRTEVTETEGRGYVRARSLSTAAQQVADPRGTAARDYGANFRVNESRYTQLFPSAHLSHDLTANLKARVSWSTSFGRPNMTNMFPTETPNEAGRFVTVSNPGLLPQSSTNWDATLDAYFKPAGYFSVGWFRKRIRDYIIAGATAGQIGAGNDNGFAGEYDGWELRTSTNGGTATVSGWEFAYQQQFTFLPGILRGLSLMANYTVLDTFGDFGGRTQLGAGEVAGFIPRTANLVPSWRLGAFSCRVRVSYTSGYLDSYNASNPLLNTYSKPRTLISPSLAYEFRPSLGVSLEVSNLTRQFQERYQRPARFTQIRDNPVSVTFGLKGRF